ncbi:MAG TPA: alpha/beta fold hydrolase [Eudoraea sp.]|nr:alpha/beta fold hydrolase [Eudoraea sp.]
MTRILHSNILGKGEPLLILHGFLGMSDNWKTLGNQYADNDMEVHLVDQRNHGRSFWDPEFNYDILADDLRSYAAHHNLASALLIGHSMGGKTAMQFACNFPHLVEKLLVADIAPKYYPPHHDAILNALNALPLEALSSRKEADKALAEHLTDPGTRLFLLKNLYWADKGKLGFRCNLEVLSTKMEEIGENIGSTDSYEGPALFLRGDRSEYISPNDYGDIKRHFPGADIETVSNAGHWLHAENPRQFFEKSLRFLKG